MSIVARLPQPGASAQPTEGPPEREFLITGRGPVSPAERQEAEAIFQELHADPRYSEFVRGCLNCGECTTGCPAARYYEYSPREMLQVAATGDALSIWDLLPEKVWACCQCYSCTMRCRFGNDIAGIVNVLRELSVRHGTASARRVLAPFGRTLTLLMTVGTQVSPDMILPEFFPDWGPRAGGDAAAWGVDGETLRHAVPIDVLQGSRAAWEVSVETSLELFRIYEEAGVVDMVRSIDPDLTEMMIDIIDTRRAELEDARARYRAKAPTPASPSPGPPGTV